ncbi:MAG: ATP-binding protein, partial [Bacteroidota bacterium]
EMDGFETLQQLRANAYTAHIPVIFLTAQRKDPESIEKGLSLGAEEFLTKPIDVEELIVRTKMILRLKKLERELERTKADFMAMLVHDLRSPLSGIKGVIEYFKEIFAQNKVLNEEQLALFDSVDDSAARMLALINDILDLSKLEAGKLSLDKQAVDLRLVVDLISRDFRIPFKNKEAGLEINIPDTLPQVYIDINRIGQVLTNLLSNSLKFINTGGNVTISAELVGAEETGEQNQQFVKVSVRDNGMGIPKEELPHIFDRYKQASTAKRTQHKGTGLGLAVCKLIVDAHGGAISADSEVGVYTTITFTIPTVRTVQS